MLELSAISICRAGLFNRSLTLASFGVHLAVGISASGLAAASVLAAGFAAPAEMLTYLGLGTLGSLLPDLDADNSAPLQIGFTVVSIALAFMAMFLLVDTFPSVAELVLLWLRSICCSAGWCSPCLPA